jgi:hypothetical protein
MPMIKINLINNENQVILGKIDHEKPEETWSVSGENMVVLGIKDYSYQLGDKLMVKTDKIPAYLVVQLDETLAPTLVYLTTKIWIYEIPLAENLVKSSVETTFKSQRHSIMVRQAYDFEITNFQNLSFNPHDQKEESGAFPHAYANVETRNESVFFAKNAIDGKYANLSHGSYPFASWGINQQTDAVLTIDFGRHVEVSQISLLMRHDFPHDSYWLSLTVEFSDATERMIELSNSQEFQDFKMDKQETTYVRLKNLKKANDKSPFPALTQIEVFGKNLVEEEK